MSGEQAVKSTAQASANYTDITESFTKGVSEINDAVAIVQKSQVYDTQPIQQLVMRLYTQVFSYLHKFMAWYTSRSRTRFLKSFNENVSRTFDEDLRRVKEISVQLSQQIQLHMAADVRISKMLEQDTNWAVKYLVQLAESERMQRESQQVGDRLLQSMFLNQFNKTMEEIRESSKRMMIEYNERMRQSLSGAGITDLLTAQAARDMETRGHDQSPSQNSEAHASATPSPPTRSVADMSVQYYQAADLKFRSRRLDEYCNSDHAFPFPELPQQLSAHPSFAARLGSFTQAMESQILYAFGRYQPEQSNGMRASAAQYVSLARHYGIPTISYFCRLSAEAPPRNRTRESVELSSLLACLVRQVVDLLPAEFTAPPSLDLSDEAFSSLDGTLRTWDQTVALFSSLAGCLRLPQLLFVVDGINLLEDDLDGAATSARVRKLVRALARLVDAPGPPPGLGIVKVLLTTAGPSSALCRELHSSRVVACGGLPSPREKGRQRPSTHFLG